jgi:hypothetical protein
MKVVDQPVSAPDFFATIWATLGCNPHEELYAGIRTAPTMDMRTPIAKLFG